MSDDDNVIYITQSDGTLIDPVTKKPVVSTEINKAFSDKPQNSMLTARTNEKAAFDGARRRYLDDLPGDARQSKAISMIMGFVIFGLSDADIAYVAGTDVETVQKIKDSVGYNKFLEACLQQMREHDTNKIRKKINAEALGATEKIAKLKNSPDEKVALAASRDLLDRFERNFGDTSENSSSKDALVIKIIDGRKNPTDTIAVDIE